MVQLNYSNEVEDEHTIIRMTKSFFNRYIRDETERKGIGEEGVIIGLMFGEILGVKDLDFLEVLSSINIKNDEILRILRDNFVICLSNPQNISISKIREELLVPLKFLYNGNIDKTRAKGLIGDLLTISLFEITILKTNFGSEIIDQEMITELVKDKSQVFLKQFLSIYGRNYEFLKLDFEREYNDLQRFEAMANALSQYLEYSRIKSMLLDKAERPNKCVA